MHRIEGLVVLAALLAGTAAGAMVLATCTVDLGPCESYPHEGCPGYGSGGSTTSSSANSSSAASSSGAGGMDGGDDGGSDGGFDAPPPACTGDPLMDPTLVRDKCGVFVSASAPPGGNGTMASPLNDLSAAAHQALLQGKVVFACAEPYTPTTTVGVNGNVTLYGSLTGCADGGTMWALTDGTVKANRAQVMGPSDQISMVLTSGSASTISVYGLDVTAPPAVKDGGSSIAVYVNGGTASLTNCDIAASNAQTGADGTNMLSTPAHGGTNGNNGQNACVGLAPLGGAPTETNCGTGLLSVGGAGGQGHPYSGGPGAQGSPNGGDGGMGDVVCTSGGNGGAGAPGAPGAPGLPGKGFGTLTLAGFAPAVGSDGQTGGIGGGGGGGGGQASQMKSCGGAGGGSGGSGGCGGAGGTNGHGGGSSIALVSAQAMVTLAGVALTAGAGGSGGRGGNPQPGGANSMGGAGGTGGGTTLPWGCRGGGGGAGGDGGPGAGGNGGHSLAIASSGTRPTLDGKSVPKASTTPAPGGMPGTLAGSTTSTVGNPGLAGACYDLTTSTFFCM